VCVSVLSMDVRAIMGSVQTLRKRKGQLFAFVLREIVMLYCTVLYPRETQYLDNNILPPSPLYRSCAVLYSTIQSMSWPKNSTYPSPTTNCSLPVAQCAKKNYSR